MSPPSTADATANATVHAGSALAPRPDRTAVVALLGANAVSLVGNQLTALAIPWFVLQTTGSAARTGLVAFCVFLPTVIAAFLGGAIADRIGHKRTSVLSDLLSGATTAMIPLLYHTVGLPFPALLLLVFLGALLDTPGATARGALLPDVAARAGLRLERANGAWEAIGSTAGLLGPPLAGLLIVAIGTSNVLWVDAATFAVSAGLIAALVPASPAPAAGTQGRYREEVLAGLRFLRRDRVLWAIATTAAVLNLLGVPIGTVLLPIYGREEFGADGARELGIALAGFGVGALVAALLFGAGGHRLPRRALFTGGLGILCLPVFLLAARPGLIGTTVAMLVVGLATGTVNPLIGTVMQERVPAELRARVFGAVGACALIAAPLGVLLAGFLTELLGLRPVLLIIAVGFAVTTSTLLLNPALRELSGTGPPGDDPRADTPGT